MAALLLWRLYYRANRPVSILYGCPADSPARKFSLLRCAQISGESGRESNHFMPLIGSYYGGAWDSRPQESRESVEKRSSADAIRKRNSPKRVLRDVGIALLLPLGWVTIIELVLVAFHIY